MKFEVLGTECAKCVQKAEYIQVVIQYGSRSVLPLPEEIVGVL